VLELIVGALVVAIFLPFVVPLSVLFGGGRPDPAPNWLLMVPLCGLGLLAIIVGALVNSAHNTFTSASWTLAYRQMTAPRGPMAAPVPPVPPTGPLGEG
jgi:hypothetical protein